MNLKFILFRLDDFLFGLKILVLDVFFLLILWGLFVLKFVFFVLF